MLPCSRFGQERSKPSTYHRYNSSGSTHEKRTHHAGRWLVICPSVGFEQNWARGTSSSTYRRRLYARRGANKRMGRVLADGTACRGGGSSSHFHMSFLSLSFVCVFYVELCTTYPVVRSVVRQLGMSPDDYECIMVAAKLAEFHKTRGFFINLCRLKAFLAGHWFTTHYLLPIVVRRWYDWSMLVQSCA